MKPKHYFLMSVLLIQACGFNVGITPEDELEVTPPQAVVEVPAVEVTPIVEAEIVLGQPAVHVLEQESNSAMRVSWNPGLGDLPESYDIYRCDHWQCFLPDSEALLEKVGSVPGTSVEFYDNISLIAEGHTLGYAIKARKGSAESLRSVIKLVVKQDMPLITEPF